MTVETTEIKPLSIDDIRSSIEAGTRSASAIAEGCFDQIKARDAEIHAYLSTNRDRALEHAARIDDLAAKGEALPILAGVPVGIKDVLTIEGLPATAGSKILEGYRAPYTATAVGKLETAGAIVLGKLNCDEFAMGSSNENSAYGPVHNPWDLARIPGGSSGGSAAAVAAGLCYGSIGTDTGGSIRIPASLCGIVGLKPTLGRVSIEGVIPLSPRLDCVGPLARTAHDAALLLEPILPRVKGEPNPRRLEKASAKPPKFTLGVPDEFFFDVVSQDVRASYDNAIHSLKKRGARLKEISIPLLNETEDAGNQIAWAEATHYHQQAGWYPARAADYGDDVRSRLEMGTKVSATTYLSALELREKFIQQFHLALEDARIDALVVPTTPITAPLIGQETIRLGDKDHPTRALLLRANRPANLAGVPAISVPCGFTPAGLPVGLQLIGAVADEHLLLQIAHSFERAHPQTRRPVP